MPKNTKPTRSALQAQKRIEQAEDRQYRAYQRHVARVRRMEVAAQKKLLTNILRNVRGKGIYDPKSLELTKYRKARAKKVLKEYGTFLDTKKYFFVKAPKTRRAEVKERAIALRLKPTSTGVFVERQGHKKATLKENKKNKELYIERSGRTKSGPLKGKRYTSHLPLASVDELDKEKDRLREMAKRMPLRNRGERLAFKIRENGIDGYSHSTFNSIEGLLSYLGQYHKSIAARINFFRHIELERVETNMEWSLAHPPMSRAERRARLRRSAKTPAERARGR